MGKIVSIYLTDEEHAELKKFCEENQCTQYSALKTALRELVSRPSNARKKEPRMPSDNGTAHSNSAPAEKPERVDILRRLARSTGMNLGSTQLKWL